jgi:tetratricopeptide (TPR) repeat protein
MFRGKSRFEQLDEYILRREYGSALEAIAEEIKKRPENFNLLLRQAEILGLAGDRDRAIGIYRKLAEHYAQQGFYARALAVINKVLRLDPTRQDVTVALAGLIAARQEAEEAERLKLNRSEKGGRKRSRKSPAGPEEGDAAAEPTSRERASGPPDDAATRQADRERAASRFFAELPRGALEALLSAAAVRSFEPHEVIVREGDPGTSFFLIEEGEVDVQTQDPAGKQLVLARLAVGDFFGEVAVLTGKPRTATITAETPVTVIEISSADLDRIAGIYPDVRNVLQRFYEQRAQATVEAMVARIRSVDA